MFDKKLELSRPATSHRPLSRSFEQSPRESPRLVPRKVVNTCRYIDGSTNIILILSEQALPINDRTPQSSLIQRFKLKINVKGIYLEGHLLITDNRYR